MKTLGEKIRYCRNLRGLSQADMAEKLDVTHSTYSKIERNAIDPNFSRLEQIAKIFEISVVDLLNISSKTKSKNEWEKLLENKDKEINALQKKLITLLEKTKK